MADNQIVDSAKFGKLTVNRYDSGSIEVTGGEFASTKEALREIAKKASIEIDESWNTRRMGQVIIQQLNSGKGKQAEKETPIAKAAGVLKNLVCGNGKPAWQTLFDKVEDAGNGLVYICKKDKWGFTTKDGKVLIEPKFDGLGDDFVEGMIVTQAEDKKGNCLCGFVNDKGVEVVAPTFQSVQDFKNGHAKVTTTKGETYLIDKSGKKVKEKEEKNEGNEVETEDVVAIVKLLLAMVNADDDVTDEETDFIIQALTDFGLDDNLMKVQIIQVAQKMPADESIKRVKKLNAGVKKVVSHYLLKSIMADGTATKDEVHTYVVLCDKCGLPNLLND